MPSYDKAQYDKLYAQLVPFEGPAQTLEGELLRAVSRIHHDYTNNGFGNNWSGALAFLKQHLGLPSDWLAVLRPYARGKVYRHASYDEDDVVLFILDRMVAKVMKFISESSSEMNPNPCDMFSLQQKDNWC